MIIYYICNMERIKLTKREKRVLRTLSRQGFYALSEFDATAVRSLDNHGLVQGAYIEGGGVEDARLTNYGKEYIADNPRLRNPIDWGKVAAIATIVGIIVTIVLFIIGCALIRNAGA